MREGELNREECTSLLVESSGAADDGSCASSTTNADDDYPTNVDCESPPMGSENNDYHPVGYRNSCWSCWRQIVNMAIRLLVLLIAFRFLHSIYCESSVHLTASRPSETNEMPQPESTTQDEKLPHTQEPELSEAVSQSGGKTIPEAIYRLDGTATFEAATLTITEDMETLHTAKDGLGITYELCQTVRALNRTFEDPIVLFNASRNSIAQLCEAGRGTGNQLVHLFDLRFAAFAERRTALVLDCVDGAAAGTGHEDGAMALKAGRGMIQPWLSGFFPAGATMDSDFNMVMPDNYCPPPPQYTDTASENNEHDRKLIQSMPLRYMLPLARQDFRRMAVALVGIPDQASPINFAVSQFEQEYLLPEAQNPPFSPAPATGNIYRIPIHHYYQNGPIYPGVEFDDVVIHFRCGDVLMGAPGCGFHYVRFAEYTRLISPDAQSIGIVTQSFSLEPGVQARGVDKLATTGDRCRKLVQEGLVAYIQERFPKAKISIRNGPNETIPLAYARMIMANQTLALNPSTFSLFPALTTFGMGYYGKPVTRKENRIQYSWVNHHLAPNLYEHEGFELLTFQSRLRAEDLANLWKVDGGDQVLEWFRNETFSYGTNERL